MRFIEFSNLSFAWPSSVIKIDIYTILNQFNWEKIILYGTIVTAAIFVHTEMMSYHV